MNIEAFFSGWISIGLSLLILITFIILIVKRRKRKKFDVAKITIADIDRMDGAEFEDYLAVLLSSIGLRTFQTAKSRDFGADLLIYSDEGVPFVIQAKRYSAKLGLQSVQEAFTAATFYGADRGIVVTSAEDVTLACWQLAEKTGTSILIREDIMELITLTKGGQVEEATQILLAMDYPELSAYTPNLKETYIERGRYQAGEYFMRKS
ncbi:restriction endonuclease [Aureibacillus halotolerans]|uniref:Restriction system protein n=1 Tax=Aureibacillus halotolerans TaxID=1508390 RepID=A0A4V3D671_9BACI|nr:restriction endonuclease [Aureibacillus halotolerans]TDQ42777.1 restriction system protein [Aureibacillus halotolerans]